MSAHQTVVGMIEVDDTDDRNLDSVFESLVAEPKSRTVVCRVRSGKLECESVPADLEQLNESLETELHDFLQRLATESR